MNVVDEVMNMKYIIYVILSLIIIVSIHAISEGNIYTQEQVDNFDLENITFSELVDTLDCQMQDNGSFVIENEVVKYVKTFGCLNLKKLYDDNGTFTDEYYTYRKNMSIKVNKDILKERIRTYGIEKCKIAYAKYFKTKAKSKILNIKDELKSYQTPVVDDLDGDDFYGGFFDEEEGEEAMAMGGSGVVLYTCPGRVDNPSECPGGLSGGQQTRCYTTLEKDTWKYCSTGWDLYT